MSLDSCADRSASAVSWYSQMIARSEVSGSDAIRAPNTLLRFATSDGTAIMTAESTIQAHMSTENPRFLFVYLRSIRNTEHLARTLQVALPKTATVRK